MPEQPRVIVTNTTPLIALTAATGSLDVLRTLYDRVVIPHEVEQEVLAGQHDTLTIDALRRASWLDRCLLGHLHVTSGDTKHPQIQFVSDATSREDRRKGRLVKNQDLTPCFR